MPISQAYLQKGLRADALAGMTVAVMGVPQAMAYALIAGLPPVYGLYTAMVTCAVAALLGSSNHLVTGPTNALCMVILSLTAALPEKYGLGIVEIVLLLTLMTGMIQLFFGLFKLGSIMRYVSNSVVVGFTAGAGILIATKQLKNILGVELADKHAERFHEILIATVKQIPDTNWHALFLGLVTAAVVIFLPKLNRKLPASLIAIVLAGAISYLLGWHHPCDGKVDIVKDIQPISGNLNLFFIPETMKSVNGPLMGDLATGALALAILGLIETSSIARAIASTTGQRIDFSKEFVGQGMSNIIGSFFSSFAGSGSFTRSAICHQSGGATRMAAVFSAFWTGLTVLLLAPFANYIPKPSLAGILIVFAYTMIEKERLRMTWKSGRNSQVVLIGTLLATLLIPLEYAIFVGVFLSILFLLRDTGRIGLTQLVTQSDKSFEEVPFSKAGPSPIATVNMEGALYFAAVEDLDYELLSCITPETKVVVLRMKRLKAVGSTAMAVLEQYWKSLNQRGIKLVVCGVEPTLNHVFQTSGLREILGEENIFYADSQVYRSTRLALARAESLSESGDNAAQDSKLPASDRKTAKQLMTPKCLRFGHEHELREATWLLSKLFQRTRPKTSHPLFLQDADATLYGELSEIQMLKALCKNVDLAALADQPDSALGSALRDQFNLRICDLANTELPHLEESASLSDLTKALINHELSVVPICDEEGRIRGLVDQHQLLSALKDEIDLNTDGKDLLP